MLGALQHVAMLAGRGANHLQGRLSLVALRRTVLTSQSTPACRPISTTCQLLSTDKQSDAQDQAASELLGETIKPTDFQKKVLVWGKLYPSIAEVPERVSSGRMKKARDLFRIRVNLLMGLMTLIGCGLMIISGRSARDSGDSLDARGRAQLEEWQRKGAEERAEKQRKEAGGK